MIIALYILIRTFVIPDLFEVTAVSLHGILLILLLISAIILIFASVGIKISSNMGSTVTNGFFRGIGFIVRQFFRGIGWVVRSIARLIPRVFRGSRGVFLRRGMNEILANVLAVLATVIVVAIII